MPSKDRTAAITSRYCECRTPNECDRSSGCKRHYTDTQPNTSSAATTELRALLTQGAAHDPPWHVADDHGTPYIRGKHGPGWYDCVAEEVSNEETANLIVAAVNALPALLDEIERQREALARIERMSYPAGAHGRVEFGSLRDAAQIAREAL